MYRYTKNVFLLVLIAGLIACGDNSTGPDVDPEDAPEFPQVQNEEAQPDFSFFENNQPEKVQGEALAETNNFYEARSVAISNQVTFSFANFYSGFLLAGSDEDPDFEDGEWVWEYSYSYENESISIKVTAQEVSNGHEWAMYWDYSDGDVSVENYKMFEGFVSTDGNSGEWVFNTFVDETSEEQIAYTSSWNVSSDTEKNMEVKWYDESEEVMFTATYEEDQPEYLVTVINSDEADQVLFWNTDTQVGYYEIDNERLCWDENFQDTECN